LERFFPASHSHDFVALQLKTRDERGPETIVIFRYEDQTLAHHRFRTDVEKPEELTKEAKAMPLEEFRYPASPTTDRTGIAVYGQRVA